MQIACGEVGSADWLGVTLGAERDEPDRAEHGARRNVRQEAAPRCLTDIDWIPAWAQRASCGDHERRAPARRRRRRGLDRDYRECAAADLARGVSRRGVVRPFASPASSSSNSRARTSPRYPKRFPKTCDVQANLGSVNLSSLSGAAPNCPPADLSLCIYRRFGAPCFSPEKFCFPVIDKIREKSRI